MYTQILRMRTYWQWRSKHVCALQSTAGTCVADVSGRMEEVRVYSEAQVAAALTALEKQLAFMSGDLSFGGTDVADAAGQRSHCAEADREVVRAAVADKWLVECGDLQADRDLVLAAAASFDCGKAATPVGKAVGGDPALAALGEGLAHTGMPSYGAARDGGGADGPASRRALVICGGRML